MFKSGYSALLTLEDDLAKTLVKDAVPGNRYIYYSPISPEGKLVLVCSAAITAASPKPKLFKCGDGEAYVQLLDKDGKPEGKKAKLLLADELTEYGVCPAPRWRGWARKNAAIMNDLLDVFKDAGCWVESQGRNGKELPHYHRIGFKGKTICVVYRNGLIGFHKSPGGRLATYDVYADAKEEKYMLFKILSAQVHSMGMWDDLVADLQAHLREKISAAS